MTSNKLTPKQEKFCHVYIETSNASEAYRQAYNAENMSVDAIKVEAYRVLNSPNVTLTIKKLQEEHKQRHMFNVDIAHKQYLEAIEIAKNIEQPATIVSATKAQCELHGIEPPKKLDVTTTITQILEECQNRSAGLPKDDK